MDAGGAASGTAQGAARVHVPTVCSTRAQAYHGYVLRAPDEVARAEIACEATPSHTCAAEEDR